MTDGVCQRLLERQLDLELAPEDPDLAAECLGDALGHGADGRGSGGNGHVELIGRTELQQRAELLRTREFPLQLLNEPSLSRFPQATPMERPRQLAQIPSQFELGNGLAAECSQRRPLLRSQRPRDAVDDAESVPTAWPSRVTSGDPA